MGNVKTVGRFSLDLATSTLTGPAEYMKARGDARLARMLSGTDATFNASARFSPNVETAILVWLQTDFAGWLGERLTAAELGVRA